MLEAIIAVSLSVFVAAAPPQDPEEALRNRARQAAARYERMLRRLAPTTPSLGSSGDCHEVIGRFCFYFHEGDPPAPDTAPEHPEIVEARTVAVRAHREWFAGSPADSAAAGALVRYLVEAEREGEAVAAARAHAWAADRRPASLLTLGLALHEAGRVPEAESVFDELRGEVPGEERDRLDDVSMLLEGGERGWYRRLEGPAREAYHRRFWALSDPSLLEPGNERRSAHYARHAWAAILSRAPGARGRPHWGRDSEEVVLRYGLPTGRERVLGPIWRLSSDFSMIEHYDSRAVPLVPRALATEGVPEPEPGEPSPLEATRVRSAYLPRSTPHFHPLTVQAARIPVDRGALLAVSARLARDTAAPPPLAPRGLLTVLDTLGQVVVRAPGRVRLERDSAIVMDAEVAIPVGKWLYQVEVRDDSSGTGGRAQHAVPVPAPERLALSDLIVAARDSTVGTRSDLTRSPGLVLRPGQAVLIWAEARGLERRGGEAQYQLEWWVEPAAPGSWLGRAARWLGRRLGLAGEATPVRVRWQADDREEPLPVRFDVTLELDPGRYRLGLRLRDRISGRAAVSTRLVLLDREAPALRRRSRD